MSRFFILRPVFTLMSILIVMVLGIVCISRLPIDLVPDVSFPTLSVSTTYNGAGPEEIEELISRPIEEAAGSVPGVEEITSESREGDSRVRVTFNFGTDLSEAANDLRERIDRIVNQLPEDADRPRLLKFDLASFPIVILGVESDLDPIQTATLIDTDIKNRIERVAGVASLSALGGLTREIHVDLDLNRLEALKIPLSQIESRLEAANLQVPAGYVDKGSSRMLLRTQEEFENLDEIRQTVVALRNGNPIYLHQVATVKDTYQEVTSLVRVNGKNGIRLAIQKQSGTNTVSVAKEVIAAVEEINRDLPQIRLTVLVDSSIFIIRSLQNVAMSVLFGGLLAVVILYFFLGSFRTTLVMGTAIPISIITTFILMYFAGYTLNTITLGGLALGVGMLVDNAIVVLENIFRNRQEGKDPLSSAITGTQQVSAAILASTLTTIAVFLPLVFVRGISGVTYQRLGMVVSFALISSLIMALTLVPMVTARLLGGKKPMTIQARRPILEKLDNFYRYSLNKALKARWLVLGTVLICFVGTLLLARTIGVEFIPESDEGEVRINAEMKVGTRLEVLSERFRDIEKVVREEVPEATDVLTELGATGFGGADAAYKGQMRIYLKGQSERSRSSTDIANALRKPLSQFPGLTVRTRPGSSFFVFRLLSGGGNNERVQVEIRGYDTDTSFALADEVQTRIQKIAGISDTQLSRDLGSPETTVVVDRAKAESLGISVSDIGRTLQTLMTGSIANSFRADGNEYNIRLKIEDASSQKLDRLLRLPVYTPTGQAVMLSNVVSIEERTGPVSIERKDQERVLTVRANVVDRPLNDVMGDVQTAIREITPPQGYTVLLAGDVEEQQKSFRDLLMGLVLSLILVYMIMAAQYESFLDPLVVMFSVPLAAIGVVLALWGTQTTFNLQSFIGCIMLGGIVVNNAIILVDQINQLRQDEGYDLKAALEEAGFRRLRPILMTTLTTALGLLPLAIGIGEGSETQAPMARTVIGGLIGSTFLTLFVVPIIYQLLEPFRKTRETPPGVPTRELSEGEAQHV